MNEYEKKNAQEHSAEAHSGNDEKQNVSRQSNEAHPHEEEAQHMSEPSNEVHLREEEPQHVSGPSNEMQSDEHEKQNNQYEKSKKSSSFFSMVMSGLVGAALILLLIMNTSFLDGVIAHKNNDDASNEAKVNDHVSDESAVPAQAPTKIDSNAVADMVEEASKAIVGITNEQQVNHPFAQMSGEREGSGSGVIIKKEGDTAYVVTNNHVIENANKLTVSLANGETVEATRVGADALSDLAVIKIPAEHVEKTLPFGDSHVLRPGEQVIAIGNPLGLEFSRTVTQGIISAVDRTININTSAGRWDLDVIQTDAAINPGNSGGALLNVAGEVIGINSLKISSGGVEGLGFAIPSNDVVPLVEEMIENGMIERPYIGISMIDLEQIPKTYLADIPDDLTSGVVVTDVDLKSAAHRAGIKSGDIVVAINDEEIHRSNDLRNYLYKELKIGDKATLTLYRQLEKKTIPIVLTRDGQTE